MEVVGGRKGSFSPTEMFITKETDYAVRCVLHLSKSPDRVVPVKEIATVMYVPRSFLAKILQKLVKAGIVESARGVKGGFRIQRPPSAVTLMDVVIAIEGPSSMNVCSSGYGVCRLSNTCAVHPVWVKFRDYYESMLRHYDFATLLAEDARGAQQGIHKGTRKSKGVSHE